MQKARVVGTGENLVAVNGKGSFRRSNIKQNKSDSRLNEFYGVNIMTLSTSERTETNVGQAMTVPVTAADVEEMNTLLRQGARIGNEQADDVHLNEIIPKPWGLEYRAYVDDFLDVWQLQLDPGQATSLHNHPRKLTYLVCLAGHGRLTTLSGEYDVTAGSVVRIEKGAFHSTENLASEERLDLVEVESPRNKYDLLRLRDGYQRELLGYESQSKLAATPLRRLPYLPHARMRELSPCKRYEFEILSGMDLYYRGLGIAELFIPLGIQTLAYDAVHVLSTHISGPHTPSADTYYLAIRRTESPRAVAA